MKRMLISVDLDESRAAVVEDGKLVHLEIEPVARDSCKGNIYRGVIARVEPSLQSAFVEFGRDKQGFLPLGEIHPKLYPPHVDKKAPIQEVLRQGQQVIVQVQRDEIGQKGATLSTFVSLPGRYLVLMPETDKTGVSRKLSDGARERIKELTDTMKVPDGFGLIVRTAGDNASKIELSKDLVYLNRLWEHIQQQFDTGRGASLLYQERSLAVRFVRDYYRKEIEEIVIDDDDALDEVKAYLSVLMPRSLDMIERYSGTVPLFARYGIQGQVEDVFSRQVPLQSGGSIVIDQTEALVSIDVNSGRAKSKDIEHTALQTNIEAAEEVARQLVLRDLGGLVVIDFIDMRDPKAVKAVEAALKNAMKNDKARHKIGKISEFGLMELSRQRIKSSVNKGAFDTCVHCSGTGFARTAPSVAASVLRRIYELVARGGVSYIVAQVPPDAAAWLLNSKRRELSDIERQYHVSIEVVAVDGLTSTQVTIEHLSKLPEASGADRLRVARFDRVVQQVDLVRNRLLKREETRIERQLAARLSGARIDYAEVYADVGERAAEVRAEEAAATAVKAAARAAARSAAPASPTAASASRPSPSIQRPAEIEDEPLPQSGGIMGWFRSLFGLSRPEPTADASALQPEAAEPVAARPPNALPSAPAHAPANAAPRPHGPLGQGASSAGAPSGAGGGHGGRDRRGGAGAGNSALANGPATAGGPATEPTSGQGPRPRPARIEAGVEGAVASLGAAGAAAGASRDPDGDDSDGRRRRRGGRRRRGRDRDDGQVDGAPGDEALAEDDGHDAQSDGGEALTQDAGDREEGGQDQGGDDGRDGDARRKRRRRGGKNRRSRVDIPLAEGGAAGDEEAALSSEDREPFEPEAPQEEGFQVVDDARDADIDGRFARLYASHDEDEGAVRSNSGPSRKERSAPSNDDADAVTKVAEPTDDAAVSAADDMGAAADAGPVEASPVAAAPIEEEEELTDVLALAEAEAARLASSDGDGAAGESETTAATATSAAPSNRFVIDLRSSGST